MRAKCCCFSIALAFCALFFTTPARAEAVIGQPAPAFVTPMLDGKNFDLTALKGKVVIVHFWATWCAPCRLEMPALEAVWRQYHGKGLEVIAISADGRRARADVEQTMHYFTFPAALLNAVTKNDFGIPGIIPVTYVIGKDGNVVDVLTPDVKPLTEDVLGNEIKSLLDAKTDTVKADTTKADVKLEAKP